MSGRGGGRGAGSVRIAGGTLGSRSVPVPRGARPTEGRVREALFSIWQAVLPGSRVLDLFAGSGVVGMEAASRGALSVVAVEADRRAFRSLERSVETLGLNGLMEVRLGSLPGALGSLAEEHPEGFHLVFADPPYAWEDYPGLVAAVQSLLARDGQLVVEHSARRELPREVPPREVPPPAVDRADAGARGDSSPLVSPLVRADTRRYGETGLSFYRRVVDPLVDP